MKLSEIKQILPGLTRIDFQTESGARVPEHFHVTEIGRVTRHFIDCGGVLRNETLVNFQLWNADDYEHRLKPGKLLHIIELSEQKLGIDAAWEVEVEYQTETIGRYALEFNGTHFILKNKQTACLAMDACGIPAAKQPAELSVAEGSCCTPGRGCC